MKAYRGLVQIECGKGKTACPRKLVKDMEAACIDCPNAKTAVMGHEGEILATVTTKVAKTRTSKKAGRQ